MYTFSNADRAHVQGVPQPPLHPARIRDEVPPEGHRHHVTLWLAVIGLAVAICCTAWYGYLRLNEDWMTGLPGSLEVIGDRMSAAEQRLAAWPGQMESLRETMLRINAQLEHKLADGLKQARKNTRDLGVSVRREMAGITGTHEQAIAARLNQLESQRQAEAARAAHLGEQVARLRERVATLTDEVQAVRVDAARESQQLRAQLGETDGGLSRLARFNSRPRERFEVARGKTAQISSGIYLHITRVDPRFRRYHGWLHLIDDGKFLWLRDQSVLQAVAFHSGARALRHDLIVTAVNEGGAAGYLILPPQGEMETAPAGAGGL